MLYNAFVLQLWYEILATENIRFYLWPQFPWTLFLAGSIFLAFKFCSNVKICFFFCIRCYTAFTEPHLICHSSNSSNVLYCDGMGMRLATVPFLICPSSGLNGLARWLGYFHNTSRICTTKQIIINHIFTFIYNVLWRCFKYELNPNSSKTQVSKYCTIPMAKAIIVSGK